MQGYLRYYLDGHYQSKYGHRIFRVLTTTTTKRLPNLIRTTQKAVIDKRLQAMFYFADREHIAPEGILNQIWRVAGDPETMTSIA